MKPTMADAYQLLHDGSLALANMERNGLRIDEAYLDKAILSVSAEIDELEQKVRSDDTFKVWRKRYGEKTKICPEQLAGVVFGELGYKSRDVTTITKRYKADKSAFADVNLPIVKTYLKLQEQRKLRSTYLYNLKREIVDGRFHASFNLAVARTYRSSSGRDKAEDRAARDFNFQNIPIRNPEQAGVIRPCFIPSKGNLLLEVDFGGIEVRISACYNHDPVLIDYIKDESKDMHRDMAAQCFLLEPEEVDKQSRYCGKNMFVFPQFYGDFYPRNARALWEAARRMDLKRKDGTPLREHLREKGIKRLGACDPSHRPLPGTFEFHIKQVEEDFWGRRFKVYTDWKKSWYQKYLERGYFDMKTGFREEGILSRNDVLNHPIQGTAFHCLLWSIIQLDRFFRKHKLRSKIIGQIHDSILFDVHPDEADIVLEASQRIMTVEIRKHWDWIIVPLSVEAEISDTNWHEKKKVKIGGDGASLDLKYDGLRHEARAVAKVKVRSRRR